MSVTRYVTRDYQRESRRQSQDPYRTDPNLTGPTAFLVAGFQDQGLLSQGSANALRPQMVLPVIGLGSKP